MEAFREKIPQTKSQAPQILKEGRGPSIKVLPQKESKVSPRDQAAPSEADTAFDLKAYDKRFGTQDVTSHTGTASYDTPVGGYEKRILEEMGQPISFAEVIALVPPHFDTSVFSQKTIEYLKNAYPKTQYWDPRLINGLGECGVYMDLGSTVQSLILVTLRIGDKKRNFTLSIPQAVQLLQVYAGKSDQ